VKQSFGVQLRTLNEINMTLTQGSSQLQRDGQTVTFPVTVQTPKHRRAIKIESRPDAIHLNTVRFNIVALLVERA
jgi:hypothetical protein